MTFDEKVNAELIRARTYHPAFHSAHEGYAVLAEEVDELWDWVRTKDHLRCDSDAYGECIQIAAMARRFAEDILGEK